MEDRIENIKNQLMSCIQGQMGDLQKVDTHELGEVIDMIKDLAEADYYCTITKAMKQTEKNNGESVNNINYYTMPYYPDDRRMTERMNGYMYYSDGGRANTDGSNSTVYYTEMPYDVARDPREGRSPIRRRMYMQGKETHNDPKSQLKELEAYLQQLSTDITEMVKDASPEQRATLHQKMATLANKIA